MEDKSLPPVKSVSPEGASDSLEYGDADLPISSYSDASKKYPVNETLEVHAEGSPAAAVAAFTPTLESVPFSRRKATIVSLIITVVVVLLTGLAAALFISKDKENQTSQLNIPTQDVSLEVESSNPLPELQGAEGALLVNGDIITRGHIKVTSGDFASVIRTEGLTKNQEFILPNDSGTICVDVNNCNYAGADEVAQQTAIQAQQAAQIAQLEARLGQLVIPDAFEGVEALNGQSGTVSIQGATNRVIVSTANGTITISTPQDLAAISSPTFASLLLNGNLSVVGSIDTTLDCTGNLNGGSLTTNASGQVVCSNDDGGGGGGAPVDATYLVASLNAALTDERALTNGSNIVFTDGGANGSFTIATTQNPTFTTSVTTPLLASVGAMNITPGGALTVGAVGQTVLLQGSTSTITSSAGNDIVLNSGDTINLQDNTNVTGSLAVSGNVTGGTYNGQTISAAANFTGTVSVATSITTPSLIFTGAGSNGGLQIANLGQPTTFTLPDPGAGSDTICLLSLNNCAGTAQNLFSTINAPGGTDPVADGPNDTLNLANGSNITMTGDSGTDTVTIAVVSNPTFSGLLTANGGVTVEAGDTFTFNGDAFTDLTGAGLVISTGSLQTTLGTDVDLTSEVTGILPIANGGTGANTLTDLIGLGAHTTGNYVATITNGNGITGSSVSEGGAAVIALGPLTANWDQTGAFDVVLNNAASELQLLESAGGAFYGVLDVGDLSADQTYTFVQGGTVVTSGNVGSFATTAVTAGGGLTGGGTTGALALNIGAGNGITVNANDITLALQSNKGLEVDGNGLSLIDCADGEVLKYETTGGTWTCAADAGASGTGDDISVNGAAATGANFVDTAASGTEANVAWSLNTGATPDAISISVGNASATEAGTVTTGAQTFAGVKTFNGQITAAAGIDLGSQTLQGTTAVINFSNFDVDGSGNIAGVTLNTTGDITSDTQVRILESAGATFYGILDVGDLSANQTFTLLQGGTVVTSGNVATFATTGVTAGSGLTGGGTTGALSLDIGAGNGIQVNANDIAVLYGSTANTAVQGNTSITVTAGTNLTGGGSITLGAGGSVTVDVADSPTFAGDVVIQGGDLTVGADSQQGSILLSDGGAGVAAHVGTLQVISTLGQNTTYTLPDPGQATATICLSTGNCAGAGGGITGSGTTNRVAKFTSSGTIGDSTITDDGTNVSITGDFTVQGGNVTFGAGSSQTGSFVLHNSINNNTVTLQSGATGSSYTLTLPTAVGTANQCLKAQNGTGTLFWDDCEGGAGGTSGVTSVNTLDGALTLQGTANRITVNDNGTDTITISTPQDIHTGATPTFAGLNATGNITSDTLVRVLENGGTPTFYGIFDVGDLSADQTFTFLNGGTVVTSGNVGTFATTGVTAGSGLTGGGTTGALTVDIASANGGIVVNANDIALTLQADKGLEVDSNGLSLIDCADGQVLKYETTGNTWGCANDGTGASQNLFETINAPGGTDPVADSATDTLNLANGTNVDVQGDSATDTITIGVVNNPTFSGLVTANGGLTVEAGDTFTFNSDAFTDLTGTGLTISAGALQTTLGTTVDLTSEVTGILPIANGGTGASTLNDLIALGTHTTGNYVAGNTAGTGIAVTGSAGEGWSPTIALDYSATLAANSLGINQSSFASTGLIFEGATADGFETLITLTDPTADNTITLPNASGEVSLLGQSIDLTSEVTGTLPVANGGTGATTFTANGVLYGNGTGAIQATAAGTTGQCLLATTGAAPSWGTCTGAGGIASLTLAGTSGTPQTLTDGDTITIAAGTNVATTAGATDTVTVAVVNNPTFSGLVTANGGLTVETGDTFTFNGDAFTDLTGTGLTIAGGALQTTLGTSVDLTSEVTGILPIANGGTGASTLTDLITLGSHTTGNYVATITNGNGITGSSAAEGGTPTIALGPLTADWDQTGAFDIVLNNASSELRVLESTGGAFYGALDVGDLSADQTYTFIQGGTVVTSGNVSSFATTGVTAGAGLTGGGTTGVLSLDIASANGGIVVNANDIALTLQANKGLEVDSNGLSLIDCTDGQILKYNGSNQWVCATDAGASGTGDDISVNGVAATNANFLNTAASGTSTSTTWSLNTGSTPDDITLAIGNASATEAGAVTTGSQTFAGAKTFNGQITAGAGIDLGAQTLQGTTAVINFNNFDVASSGDTTIGGQLGIGTAPTADAITIAGGAASEIVSTGDDGFELVSGGDLFLVFDSDNGEDDEFTVYANGSTGVLTITEQGQLLVQDASAASPAYTFYNEPDTGMFLSGANALGFATAGVERLTIGATGIATLASDIQVNGNTTLGNASGDTLTVNGTAVSLPNDLNFDSNTLFIESGANTVSIGTTSSTDVLTVNGGIDIHPQDTPIEFGTSGSKVWTLGPKETNNKFSLDYQGNERFTFSNVGNFGVRCCGATDYPAAMIHLGSVSDSYAAWDTDGVALRVDASTFTDTSTTTTNAIAVINSFATPTLAASNPGAITTNAATVYIQGGVANGTNMTITNSYALWVDSGLVRFDGDVIADAGAFFVNSSGDNVGIGTTSPAAGSKLHVMGDGSNSQVIIQASNGDFDPFVRFTDGTSSYSLGFDDTDSDAFVLSAAATLGTNNILRATSSSISLLQNSSVTGTLDVSSTIQAGSSNVNLTLATGFIDGDALTLTVAADGGTGISSGSGLMVRSDGIGLLQGCSDGQVLKWVESTDTWDCAADNGSGSTPTLQDVYNNDADGSNAVVGLTSTDGSILIRDNATPLGGTLFAVQDSAGSSDYLAVAATGVTTSGTLTVQGTGTSSFAGLTDFNGTIAVGNNATPTASFAMDFNHNFAGTNCALGCYGQFFNLSVNGGTPLLLRGLNIGLSTANTAFTLPEATGVFVGNTTRGAASTITNAFGVLVAGQTAATSNAGIAIGEATGTNQSNLIVGQTTIPSGTYSIYNSSTDQNYFAGSLGVGDSSPDGRLDVELASTSTTAGTERGISLTVSDTGVVTTGTDTTYGEQVSVTRTGATGGTINTTGLDVGLTVDNAGAGTHTAVGLNVNISGSADNNYAALFQGGNVGIGDTTPVATFTVGSGDLFQIAGATGNATTSGDVAVNGGDVTSTAAAFNITTTNASGAIALRTNSTTRLTVSNTSITSTVPILVPSGEDFAPGFGFSGDSDTGLWRPGDNLLAVVTSGAERVRFGETYRMEIQSSAGVEIINAGSPNNLDIASPEGTNLRLDEDDDDSGESFNIVTNTGNNTIFSVIESADRGIVFIQGWLRLGAQDYQFTTTQTLEPLASYVEATCNTGGGCTLSFNDATSSEGQTLFLVSNGANTITVNDVDGQQELSATPFVMGQYDTIMLIYTGDRWVEYSRSNNEP